MIKSHQIITLNKENPIEDLRNIQFINLPKNYFIFYRQRMKKHLKSDNSEIKIDI